MVTLSSLARPASGGSDVTGVACAEVSKCVAAVVRATGSAKGTKPSFDSFLVTQTASGWSVPQAVPAIATRRHSARIVSIQCPVVASCEIAGVVNLSSTSESPFVMSWDAGHFSPPHVFSLHRLGAHVHVATVTSMSCPSPGSCSAVGQYERSTNNFDFEPFSVAEVAGKWQPVHVRGAYASATHGNVLLSVSCNSLGNCLAVGGSGLRKALTSFQPMTVTETSGVWGAAKVLHLSSAPAVLRAVSCGAPGSCTAILSPSGAAYYGVSASEVTLSPGKWGTPSPAPLSGFVAASLSALTCDSMATCVAVGSGARSTPQVGLAPIVATSVAGAW